MATGDSNDILTRVKQELPRRWFSWAAPLRDAVLGGLSDGAANLYGFYVYAKRQTRIATAQGIFLDLISYDFLGRYLPRRGMRDDAYRTLILATILKPRVTRDAMVQLITALTGTAPWIFEPWNTNDTGAYSGPGKTIGTMGYGVGVGGYGNMNMPCQVLMKVHRSAPSGIPNIAGYGGSIGGYGVGKEEYVGPSISLTGLTDAQIYQAINQTRPTDVAAWVQFV